MALIHSHFFSDVLGLSTQMEVILPEPRSLPEGAPATGFPTLFFLHGLTDDTTAGLRYLPLERLVWGTGLAVVMPQVQRSFYADMVHGQAFHTFLAEELPELCRRFFPLSPAREDTFLAGVSMGGYGAFHLALSYPERFGAAISLAGTLDRVSRIEQYEAENRAEHELIFGDLEAMGDSPYHLFNLLASAAAHPAGCPALFQACGTEDFLYAENQSFRARAEAAGLPLTYVEGPGEHKWAYWEEALQEGLAWLPLRAPWGKQP